VSERWLDFVEDMRHYIYFDTLFLIYLNDGKSHKIPSARFWAIMFLQVNMLKSIDRYVFLGNEILTPMGCFEEMEDCWRGVKSE
jgi:hypothetical protein